MTEQTTANTSPNHEPDFDGSILMHQSGVLVAVEAENIPSFTIRVKGTMVFYPCDTDATIEGSKFVLEVPQLPLNDETVQPLAKEK